MRPVLPLRPLRATLALFLAALVFAVATLVHLPALHRALHERATAGQGAHSHEAAPGAQADACAISLFAQGLDAPWLGALIALPETAAGAAARIARTDAPHADTPRRLPPSQAPPRFRAS